MADSQHHDEVGNTKESNLGGDEDDTPRNPHREKPSNVVTVEVCVKMIIETESELVNVLNAEYFWLISIFSLIQSFLDFGKF